MTKRGRMMYVPPVVIEEVCDLQKEHAIISRSEAFKKIRNYARVGRELERIMKFDFRWMPTNTEIDDEKKSKIKRLFDGGPF